MMESNKKYYVYIMTNRSKNVLYIGVTNNLLRRINEHSVEQYHGFTAKYKCFYLLYYEEFRSINNAIKREKQIKSWRREKKDALILSKNPNHQFLNEIIKSM